VIRATLHVEVKDHQGNITRVARSFATVAQGIFANGFESGDTSAWSATSQ